MPSLSLKMKSRSTKVGHQLKILPKLRTNSLIGTSPSTAAQSDLIASPTLHYSGPKYIWQGKTYPDFSYKPLLSRRKYLSIDFQSRISSIERPTVEDNSLSIEQVAKIRQRVIHEILNRSVDDVRGRFVELRTIESLEDTKEMLGTTLKSDEVMRSRSQFCNTYCQAAALPQRMKRNLKLRLVSVLPKRSVYTRLSVLEKAS